MRAAKHWPARMAGSAYATAAERLPGRPACVVLGLVTVERNADYHDAELLWRQTLAIAPHNPACNNLGKALFDRGEIAEAIVHYRQALRLDPQNVEGRNNLGGARPARGNSPRRSSSTRRC